MEALLPLFHNIYDWGFFGIAVVEGFVIWKLYGENQKQDLKIDEIRKEQIAREKESAAKMKPFNPSS